MGEGNEDSWEDRAINLMAEDHFEAITSSQYCSYKKSISRGGWDAWNPWNQKSKYSHFQSEDCKDVKFIVVDGILESKDGVRFMCNPRLFMEMHNLNTGSGLGVYAYDDLQVRTSL